MIWQVSILAWASGAAAALQALEGYIGPPDRFRQKEIGSIRSGVELL